MQNTAQAAEMQETENRVCGLYRVPSKDQADVVQGSAGISDEKHNAYLLATAAVQTGERTSFGKRKRLRRATLPIMPIARLQLNK